MATVQPFRALRPDPSCVEEIASVPYDVISVDEAREQAEGKPLSFLHVVRPEIDCPEGTDEHDDVVYERGAENLRAFRESDVFVTESEPALYVYRLEMNGRPQVGVFGCVSVDEYDEGTIVRHEKTRPVKEDDRTRHVLTQCAHAEPVMLTFRGTSRIGARMEAVQDEEPLFDFEADDGVRHTVWKVPESGVLAESFGAVDSLFIADGHHRCKAASRAAAAIEQREGVEGEEYRFFPAVLFPMDQMEILPYNRIVYELPEAPAAFRARLAERFDLEPDVDPRPAEKGRVAIYLDGRWWGMELPPSRRDAVAARLDVARLAEHVLEPMLGVTDPRTDENIDFVGGIRGTDELEDRVESGKAQMAISMVATDIEELVAVAEAGELMPPKSTWFEPKLRSGLLVHLFNC